MAWSSYISYGSGSTYDYPIYSSSGYVSYSSSSSFSASNTTGNSLTFSGSDGGSAYNGGTVQESLYNYSATYIVDDSTTTITIATSYVNGQGFAVDSDTYYFTDGGIILQQYITSDTNGSFSLRKTTQTELSSELYGVTISWTDATTTLSNVNVQYTDVLSLSTIGSEIEDIGTLYFDQAIINIHTACGYVWTAGQQEISYLHAFTSIGSASHSDGLLLLEDENATVPALTATWLSGNITPAKSENTTIQEESNITITYHYLSEVSSTFTISSNSIQFDGIRFNTNSDIPTTFEYVKPQTATSSITFNLASEISFSEDGSGAFSRDIFTTTKAIQISTTDIFYHINSFYSYFESFTYSGLIRTTAESSYLLFQSPEFGSASSSSEDISTFYTVEIGMVGDATYAGGTTNENASSETYFRIPQHFYISFYSLGLGIVNDEWKKYYTRRVANSNFAVQHSNGSSFSYVKDLAPTSVLTNCFFTSYIFERVGAGQKPVFYVPIAYTSIGTDSKTTEQVVSVPQGFYFGSTSATIYWTTKSDVNSTSIESGLTSHAIGYAGAESMLSIGYDSVNDFLQNTFSPPFGQNKIFHTEPSIYSGSWLKDGYYYYNSDARTSDGAASNAISVIGHGEHETCIGSQYVAGIAFPLVSILRSYVNSYGY